MPISRPQVFSVGVDVLGLNDTGTLAAVIQSGAANMVEYYANNSNDRGDYVIAEKLTTNNADMKKALRYMFKPSLDGGSPDCYAPTIGSLDVHYSSGVANHFYYLLAEGAVVPAGFGSGT